MKNPKLHGTKEKIVQKALEMFNEAGVEYVGMRELAEALGMRIGNLTYYFPTKDDLVNHLSLELAAENNKTIVPVEDLSLKSFFGMLEQVFLNHIRYRCLMLSFVHLMKRNLIIAKRYSKVQTQRNETWTANIKALQKNKYIANCSAAETDFLVSTIALIARFWISEAAISFRGLNDHEQMRHYINMVGRIFLPYATAKGKKEIEERMSSPQPSP